MRAHNRFAALAACMALASVVGGGFVPIEREPHEDDREPEPEPEPDTERPIARTAAPVTVTERPQAFGARAERRRQARVAQRGGR